MNKDMKMKNLDAELGLNNVRNVQNRMMQKLELIDTLYENKENVNVKEVRALNNDFLQYSKEIINATGKLIRGEALKQNQEELSLIEKSMK